MRGVTIGFEGCDHMVHVYGGSVFLYRARIFGNEVSRGNEVGMVSAGAIREGLQPR